MAAMVAGRLRKNDMQLSSRLSHVSCTLREFRQANKRIQAIPGGSGGMARAASIYWGFSINQNGSLPSQSSGCLQSRCRCSSWCFLIRVTSPSRSCRAAGRVSVCREPLIKNSSGFVMGLSDVVVDYLQQPFDQLFFWAGWFFNGQGAIHRCEGFERFPGTHFQAGNPFQDDAAHFRFTRGLQ